MYSLIIVAYYSYSVALLEVKYFPSQQKCVDAGELLIKNKMIDKWACVYKS